jgi:hypothetical protein
MLLFILEYQYINTLKHARDVAAARRLHSDDVDTATNTTTNTTTIEGDPYVVSTGDMPDNITGVLNVSYDPFAGYIFYNETHNFWAPDIHGRLICTNYNGSMKFAFEPEYDDVKIFSIAGLFVLLAFTTAITLALTAVWPMLMSVDKGVSYLVEAERERHGDKEDDVQFQSLRWHRFKVIWLSAGGIVVCALSAVLAHVICMLFGLPTITELERRGECLFLDTSTLGNNEGPFSPAKMLRKIRGDNISDGDITDVPNDMPRAQTTINEDGSVDFYVNCEGSMYQASTGAIWTIVPEYAAVCEPVPHAFHLLETRAFTHTKCTLGSWKGEAHGTAAGWPYEIDWGTYYNGERCGVLSLGKIQAHSWANWRTDTSRQWEFCRVAQQPTYMRRVDPDGNSQIMEFESHMTVDPKTARQYGWFTAGDEEIIAWASMDFGRGTTFVLDKTLNTQEKVNEYMKQYHFRMGGDKLQSIPASGIDVRPNSFECRMVLTLRNGNDFQEFQQPCEQVSANVAGNDDTAGVEISTTSTIMCTITVGFMNTTVTTVISLNKLSPVTLRGANKWKCHTYGHEGIDCDHSMPFEDIDPEIVTSFFRTVVSESSPDMEGSPIIDLEVKSPSLFNFDEVKSILLTIFLILGCVVVLVVVVWIAYKIIQKKCKKQVVEVRTTTQQPPQGAL